MSFSDITQLSRGTIVQTTVSTAVISTRPCRLLCTVIQNGALVGTATITGFTDDTGAARNYILGVGASPALNFWGAACPNGLSVTLSSASDAGKLIVLWDLL